VVVIDRDPPVVLPPVSDAMLSMSAGSTFEASKAMVL
jgi:hypothetical protein